MGAAFTIPDAILADIVDYDELHTGLRNEGLYSVVENNLQQYVEIIGGVVPGIVAGLSGFVSNGGCSCGCGTACPQPYLRWSCEAPVSGLPDIGYACSSDFTAEVLNGDVDPYLLCLPTYLLCLPPTYYVPCSLCTYYAQGTLRRRRPHRAMHDADGRGAVDFPPLLRVRAGRVLPARGHPGVAHDHLQGKQMSTCVSKEVTRYHAPRLARFTFLLTGV